MITNLKNLRDTRKETQADLARFLKITTRTLMKYEHGIEAPRLDIVYKLADYYNVTIEEIFPKECYAESELCEAGTTSELLKAGLSSELPAADDT